MPISRRHLLYAMLGALALAACSGVLALITANSDTVWRVAGTCFIAAIAAAIMMPMSAWADKPPTRTAGLTGMCIAIAELGLAAVLIWGDFFSSPTREFIAMTAAILAGCGLTAVWFLKEIITTGWQRASQLGSIGCVVAGLLFLAAAYEESFSAARDGEQFFASAMSLFWSVIAASLACVGWQRPDPRPWRWAGVVGAAAAAAMVSYSAWIKKGDDPTWVVAAYALAYCVAHAIICFRATLTPGQRWVRIVAITAAGAAGFLSTYGVSLEPIHELFNDFTTMWRMTMAAGIICVSASLALVVFGRLNKRPVVQLSKSNFESVAVVCPRCQKHLTLPVGGALCDGCKLHINITLASTQCAKCGYDLTDLKTDKCPECGILLPSATKGMTESIEG